MNYNPLDHHTQEKLRVYSEYLQVYLEVLLGWVGHIGIYDMFAGKGLYGENSTKGSAILALDIIKKFLKRYPNKISLYLNDNNKECYQSLLEHTQPDVNRWVKCTQMKANDAIMQYTKQNPRQTKLFYLDPFGYNQLKRSSIDAIIGNGNGKNECFLFVPVTRIAQFVRKGKPVSEQMPSVAEFCREYNIDMNAYQDSGWHQWGKIIKESLADTYRHSYVGIAVLETSGANHYALYFIGNHVYGLDRFLDNASKSKKGSVQLGLFSMDENESNVQSYLSEGSGEKTNNQIYEHVLRKGIIPSAAKVILESMKKQGKISVRSLLKDKPARGFYLSHSNYKEHPRIKVKWNCDRD